MREIVDDEREREKERSEASRRKVTLENSGLMAQAESEDELV